MSDPRLLLLSPRDNVCAATRSLAAGEEIVFEGRTIRLTGDVPVGHKVAVLPIAAGEKVPKYGAPIGSASMSIAPGDHVHQHNLRSDYLPPTGRPGSAGEGVAR